LIFGIFGRKIPTIALFVTLALSAYTSVNGYMFIPANAREYDTINEMFKPVGVKQSSSSIPLPLLVQQEDIKANDDSTNKLQLQQEEEEQKTTKLSKNSLQEQKKSREQAYQKSVLDYNTKLTSVDDENPFDIMPELNVQTSTVREYQGTFDYRWTLHEEGVDYFTFGEINIASVPVPGYVDTVSGAWSVYYDGPATATCFVNDNGRTVSASGNVKVSLGIPIVGTYQIHVYDANQRCTAGLPPRGLQPLQPTSDGGFMSSDSWAYGPSDCSGAATIICEGYITYKLVLKPVSSNQPPVAVASANKTEVFSGETVELDGSGSFDPDNNLPLQFSWSEPTTGFTSSGERTAFVAPNVQTETTYAIELNVIDSLGAQSIEPAIVNVLVKPVPVPPPPPPPICPPTRGGTLPNLESHDDISNNQLEIKTLAKDPPRCGPPALLKGMVFVKSSSLGDLPLKNIRIQLLSQSGLIVQNTTDKDGKYEILIPPDFSTKNVQLRFELSMIKDEKSPSNSDTNKIFNVRHKIFLSRIVFIETTPIDLASKDIKFKADIIFQTRNPVILLNKIPFPFSQLMKEQNIESTRLPHLAAIYYYTSVGIDFGRQYLFVSKPLTQQKPLAVIGFYESPDPSRRVTGFDEELYRLQLLPEDSLLAQGQNNIRTELTLDTIFHEMGHFLAYEFRGGENRANQQVHEDLQNVDFSKYQTGQRRDSCHLGYAYTDSSCAFLEGQADFISAAISDTSLKDGQHQYFINNADRFVWFDGQKPIFTNLEFDEDDNPVGPRIKKATNPPFFNYAYPFEEFNIANLLWDLYDKRADGEQVSRPLNVILPSILSNNVVTVSDAYNSLLNSAGISKLSLDSLYAKFDLCLDGYIFRNSPDPIIIPKDGRCDVNEVKDGRTAWSARFSEANKDFGYPVDLATNKLGRP
jgi:hypothetical protein